MLAAVLLVSLSGCHKSDVRRVVVVYPEHWSEGEYRNCALGATDPVTNLPQLDCDLQAAETPRSRMFTMDVEFDGIYGDESRSHWTCEKRKDSLVCRN
jgi:hypothetical protein